MVCGRWIVRGWLRFALAAGCGGPATAAERTAEIAAIHLEALGGRARVEALTALRMSGTVVTADGRTVPIRLLAARPRQLRLEMELAGRTVVRGTDGVRPPWQFDPAGAERVAVLTGSDAEDFVTDADFDDLLVPRSGDGLRLEFAGEATVGVDRELRVLAVRSPADTVLLALDPTTYLIRRRTQRRVRDGRTVELTTRYSDYRPVQGVMLAHTLELFADGKRTQRAEFTRIEPNPPVRADAFAPPARPETQADAAGKMRR